MKKRKQLFKDYLQEYKNIWKRILGKSKLIPAIIKIIVGITKIIVGIIKIIVGIIKTIAGIIKTIVNKFISFLLNAVVILLLAVMVCWVYFLIDAEAKVIFTNIEVGSIIKFIEEKLKIEFSLIGSALIAIIGLKLFLHRLEKQEEQIDLQRKQRTDDRFTTAVELLGSSETSARTGAIYSLYHLSIEDKKYRKEVAQILCSHIRSKTNEPDYQKEHKDRPSNEIQSTIDLLLKNQDGNKGLYCQDFAKEKNFPQANFEYAYLVKANFRIAQCQGAIFNHAQCQGAILIVHSVKEQILIRHSVKEQILIVHSVKEQSLIRHSVKEQVLVLHSVKEHILLMHSVKEQSLIRHSVKKQVFMRHSVKQQILILHSVKEQILLSKCKCQGADFTVSRSKAQCQGADFY